MADQSVILSRVEESSQSTYTKGEVKSLINSITPQHQYHSFDKVRVGDVFMAKAVGGKSRPWVIMFTRKGMVGAAALTHHTELTHSYPSKCRFYPDGAIGPTIALFEEERILDCCMTPYSNKKHLAEVKKDLLSIWCK